MPDYLLRPEPTTTLEELRDEFRIEGLKTILVEAESIEVKANGGADPSVSFKAKEGRSSKTHEVPLNGPSLISLSSFLDIPKPFIRRQDADMQTYLLAHLLKKKPGDILVEFTKWGIQEVRPPSLEKIDPVAVIDVAERVIGKDAIVVNGYREDGDYSFDVMVPDGHAAIGGDPAVGDITKGGLRFGQNTKDRLAPWVQTFLYRLECTNGMEVPDLGMPVRFQGNTLPEVMEALEISAQQAFGAVEAQINAFYDLREQKIGDASMMVARVAQERGLSSRITTDLIERLPSLVDDPEDATMFEVVNAITNMANHVDLIDRPAKRRKIQQAGGILVREHAARCPRCKAAL